jgi:predicted amidohydrolase YtcJ
MFRVDTATHWIDGAKADARELANTVIALRKRGWRVTFHADASDAVDLALDAFSIAASAATLLGAADGIERRGPLPAGGWVRLRRLGLSTGLIMDEGIVPNGTAADLREAGGVPISVSLDMMAGLFSPLQMLSRAAAVVGKTRVADWLLSVTRGAATRCGVGAILGSLEVGKYADFALLSGDPRNSNARDASRICCVGTWLGGREIRP